MTKVTSIRFDYGAIATRDGRTDRRLASCSSLAGVRTQHIRDNMSVLRAF